MDELLAQLAALEAKVEAFIAGLTGEIGAAKKAAETLGLGVEAQVAKLSADVKKTQADLGAKVEKARGAVASMIPAPEAPPAPEA